MDNQQVTYDQFLLVLESPQFKKNAETIFSFLQKTAEEAYGLSVLIGAHKRMFLTMFNVYEELRCLKELRTKNRFIGSDYQLLDEDLVHSIADQVETAYLNHLVSIESVYSRFTTDEEKYEEARKDNSEEWLKDDMADELSFPEYIDYYYKKNELKLGSPNRVAKTLIDWKERVASFMPFSDAVVLTGRPIKVQDIDTQIEQVSRALGFGKEQLSLAEDVLIDDFIQTLLNARVKLDNKLYRDVYNTLNLFGRLPKEIVESHDNNIENNQHNRETYIRQKFYRLIDQSADLKRWYHRLDKPLRPSR